MHYNIRSTMSMGRSYNEECKLLLQEEVGDNEFASPVPGWWD